MDSSILDHLALERKSPKFAALDRVWQSEY